MTLNSNLILLILEQKNGWGRLKSFKFQSDSINTAYPGRGREMKAPLNSNLILLILGNILYWPVHLLSLNSNLILLIRSAPDLISYIVIL